MKKSIVFIAFLLVVILTLVSLMSKNIKVSKQEKQEQKLIQEGNVVDSNKFMEELVEILKKRDEEKLKDYLSSDFSYYNNNNTESKYINNFWSDLKFYTGKSYIEERGDTLNQENKTFWIYWDIPEQLEYKQYSQYSLQKICIYMRRIVKEDIIIYEINQIILKNN